MTPENPLLVEGFSLFRPMSKKATIQLGFVILLTVFICTSCSSWKDEKIKGGIERFFDLGNKSAGGGTTSVSNIEILEKVVQNDSCMVTAVVNSYFENNSLQRPISQESQDTITFIMVFADEPLVLKVSRYYND